MWKTGWILTVAGRASLYALDPTFLRMVYRPICLWSSLFDGRVVRMCFSCSQTLSPGFRTGSGCCALLASSASDIWASLISARSSSCNLLNAATYSDTSGVSLFQAPWSGRKRV